MRSSSRVKQLGVHVSHSKIAFGEQRIVGATGQPEVICRGLAASAVRDVVMKLEKALLATALAIRAHERALPPVPLVYLAHHRARDVA
jgi:hypothetical protein